MEKKEKALKDFKQDELCRLIARVVEAKMNEHRNKLFQRVIDYFENKYKGVI